VACAEGLRGKSMMVLSPAGSRLNLRGKSGHFFVSEAQLEYRRPIRLRAFLKN